jgi:pyrrolysyl-tRNA synthetase-like protein
MIQLRRTYLYNLVAKVKLWPSKSGVLHGVRSVENLGIKLRIITYCGDVILLKNSRRGRGHRWIRNRYEATTCHRCGIPSWKIERFLKGRLSQS